MAQITISTTCTEVATRPSHSCHVMAVYLALPQNKLHNKNHDIKSVYRKAVEEGTTYQEAAAAIGTPKAIEAAEKLLLFEGHYNRLSGDELYMELCVLPEVESGERPLFWDEEHWY